MKAESAKFILRNVIARLNSAKGSTYKRAWERDEQRGSRAWGAEGARAGGAGQPDLSHLTVLFCGTEQSVRFESFSVRTDTFFVMPRNARLVCAGVPHHVTQRGVNRADVFFSQRDRQVYLDLVRDNLESYGVRVLAWCLMTNHVHWVVMPEREESLAVLFRRVHGRYAQYVNVRRRRSGHFWQNRFFSCALGPEREEAAIRYVEWDPLRAGLVKVPDEYGWSSAASHLHGSNFEQTPLLDWSYWQERGGAEGWRSLLGTVEDVRDAIELRQRTYSGAPFGSEQFVKQLEERFGRQWLRTGRPQRKAMQKRESGTERSVTLHAS